MTEFVAKLDARHSFPEGPWWICAAPVAMLVLIVACGQVLRGQAGDVWAVASRHQEGLCT